MGKSMTISILRRNPLRVFFLVAIASVLAGGIAISQPTPGGFASGRASFAVAFQDEVARYRVMAGFVLPGEEVRFRVVEDERNRSFQLEGPDGLLLKSRAHDWVWQAPVVTGVYPVRVTCQDNGESILLNVFVLVPFSQVVNGRLNGYRIGSYPDKPLKGLDIYKPPVGFVEVTAENPNTAVSPHFTLGQFLCKQESGYPKYLVLRTRLLRKLEFVLQTINRAGIRCDQLTVMSGYRTPWYNKAIGNVQYSRHVWGGAADVYVDVDPIDGQMDDLNKDGKIDIKDAAVVYRIIDDRFSEDAWTPFMGGLGQYRVTASHGPFVHVDVRGFRARWGD